MTTQTEIQKSAAHSDGNGQPHGEHGQAHDDPGALLADLHKPSTFTVVIVVCVFALLLAALFFIGWYPKHNEEAAIRKEADQRMSQLPMVGVTNPKATAHTKDVLLPCDVRAWATTDLYPRANGYLKRWLVDIQAHVEKGQLLAEIETPDIDAQLQQSEATLELNKAAVVKSRADLKLADVTLKRYVDAQKTSPGSVTQEDVDSRQAAYDDAVAALAQAEANVAASAATVQQYKVLQGFEQITAPFSGTITARNYDAGALLNSTGPSGGKPIFSMAQTDTLRVWVSVPQTYSTDIKTGQAAYLEVINYPHHKFQGTVARTAGAIDPTTRTLSVELDFHNADGKLYAGMYGNADLPIAEANPVLTIPTSALVFNATGLHVGLVKDGKVHIQEVKVGRDMGTEIEVTNGLSAEDQVITNPGDRIAEGVEVNVATPPANPATPEQKKPTAEARASAN